MCRAFRPRFYRGPRNDQVARIRNRKLTWLDILRECYGLVECAALAKHVNAGQESVLGNCGRRFLLSLVRSEEHTSELQSHSDLVCRLLLEKKKLNMVASLPLIKERILVIILLLHFLSLMLGSVLVLMLPLLVWLTPALRIKQSLLKCNATIRKRLPRCKMRLKKRLLAFSRRLHARIR